MNSQLRSLVLFTMLSLGTLSGCGGGDNSDSSDGFTTGVDGSKVLSELTPEELRQMCAATGALMRNTLTDERMCRLFAVAIAAGQTPMQSQQTCEANVSLCLSGEGEEVSVDCEKEGISSIPCSATVDLYEKCYEESSTEFAKQADRAQCSQLEAWAEIEESARLDPSKRSQSPSCVELYRQCPELNEE